MRRVGWVAVALAGLALWAWQRQPAPPRAGVPAPVHAPVAAPGAGQDALPAEARATLRRIAAGGPFVHAQDGAVFGNREHRLPPRPRGWYREYTVDTPGARDRGARRIVAGGDPPREYWYTDDHYRSFRQVAARGAEDAR